MTRDARPPAIFLMGPTASGKTAVALTLAARLPVDIVSVDSALVYRDMDIGTAKPDAATLQRFPHRLIDIITPEESYSAARFRAEALAAMGDISSRGRVPLLVGGTMLYFKALREGLSDLPQADAQLRVEIERAACERGWPALHAELAALDAATAARLKPTDAQRIQRALEVVRVAGQAMSSLLAQRQHMSLPYRVTQLALVPTERSVLHARIARRFDDMLAQGLVDELRALRETYDLHAGLPSMRCVGYRQAWDFIEGAITHAELRDKGIFATRQLAKRQLTWVRATAAVQCFDCFDPHTTAKVLAHAERFLSAR